MCDPVSAGLSVLSKAAPVVSAATGLGGFLSSRKSESRDRRAQAESSAALRKQEEERKRRETTRRAQRRPTETVLTQQGENGGTLGG